MFFVFVLILCVSAELLTSEETTFITLLRDSNYNVEVRGRRGRHEERQDPGRAPSSRVSPTPSAPLGWPQEPIHRMPPSPPMEGIHYPATSWTGPATTPRQRLLPRAPIRYRPPVWIPPQSSTWRVSHHPISANWSGFTP